MHGETVKKRMYDYDILLSEETSLDGVSIRSPSVVQNCLCLLQEELKHEAIQFLILNRL